MFGAIYTGMSGLTAFSKGLDTISNNVANLNTPGYKGSEFLFQDLFYQYQLLGEYNNQTVGTNIGRGVEASNTYLMFAQGDVRNTGTDTDTAINGNGFFVLKDSTTTYYSRGGQFRINNDGALVLNGNDDRYVMALDQNGNLQQINITGLKTATPQATTLVKLQNILSTASDRFEVPGVNVYDVAGSTHTLKLVIVHQDANNWTVEVQDENAQVIATGGDIRFNGDGTPTAGYNQFQFTLTPDQLDSSVITIDFGDPNSYSGVRSLSGSVDATNVQVASVDGRAVGALTSVSFDREGYLTLVYSNGQSEKSSRLALAMFDDLQGLKQVGGGLFLADQQQTFSLSHPTDQGMGEIAGKSLELSNVELTQQFTDLIVVQRGYQASSQILTAANEMIQQLIDTLNSKR